jgi:hypothetical protein
MIATALIDRRVQLEMDLIEPVDEANPQVLSIGLSDQAFRDSFRQSESEQPPSSLLGPLFSQSFGNPRFSATTRAALTNGWGRGAGSSNTSLSSISATISTSFVVLEFSPVAFSAVPPHTTRLYRGAPSRANRPFRSCKASSKWPGSLMSLKGRIKRTINDIKGQCKS